MKIYRRLLSLITALVLGSGAIFIFSGFFTPKIPDSVSVDGICVGKMSYVNAINCLREDKIQRLKCNTLRIYAGESVLEYTYPQINFVDDLSKILHAAKKGGIYASNTHYYLVGANAIADGICGAFSRDLCDPFAIFNLDGTPFAYDSGFDGVTCDKDSLLADIDKSVNGKFEAVYARINTVLRSKTLEDIKQNTRLLYSFSTRFDEGNTARTHNIKLACEKINGVTLKSGEVFSFNATVGARTAERGFKQAKIIEDGKFVKGFGGGVCQVSTTLYNCALLSGLKICEQHAHSLAVGYVPLSRDAMVSGSYCDLKFKNNRKSKIYIRAIVDGGRVTCAIYGAPDGWNYSFESLKVEGEEGKTNSEGYLICQRGEMSIKKLVRRDSYSLAQ